MKNWIYIKVFGNIYNVAQLEQSHKKLLKENKKILRSQQNWIFKIGSFSFNSFIFVLFCLIDD